MERNETTLDLWRLFPMKAISLDLILTSASTKVDNSLSLRFTTPELQASEKTAFFELQNKLIKAVLQPTDEVAEELIHVKAILGFKTPSQRLRAVLYRRWEQEKPDDVTFQDYYVQKMEGLIEKQKQHLSP